MVYLFLAQGFEEMEGIITADYLRRAGVDVMLVGLGGKTITGSHGIPVTCDGVLEEMDIQNPEGLLLPGGMPGTTNLYESKKLCELLKKGAEEGCLLGAICAAPSVLGKLGLLQGKKAICYPGFEGELAGATVVDAPAVVCGNIITGKGPGAAMDFGYALASYLKGEAVARQVQEDMQWRR